MRGKTSFIVEKGIVGVVWGSVVVAVFGGDATAWRFVLGLRVGEVVRLGSGVCRWKGLRREMRALMVIGRVAVIRV